MVEVAEEDRHYGGVQGGEAESDQQAEPVPDEEKNQSGHDPECDFNCCVPAACNGEDEKHGHIDGGTVTSEQVDDSYDVVERERPSGDADYSFTFCGETKFDPSQSSTKRHHCYRMA